MDHPTIYGSPPSKLQNHYSWITPRFMDHPPPHPPLGHPAPSPRHPSLSLRIAQAISCALRNTYKADLLEPAYQNHMILNRCRRPAAATAESEMMESLQIQPEASTFALIVPTTILKGALTAVLPAPPPAAHADLRRARPC